MYKCIKPITCISELSGHRIGIAVDDLVTVHRKEPSVAFEFNGNPIRLSKDEFNEHFNEVK
ncbi:hypothetical protein G7062_11345 [Erysipelothrix sp. HDW6C]|uniref:hypothetical protein n=1 Tax=Erysipelothrix sp. HDW6C TaxID=2714930 RepID=UPI00140DCC6F|nr:hypothetical protein [Erysipelothrix sp. HDW6C]QIK70852.1 hypothetical protein G7062_11345 [Erysipelothrix sp. HDW6C]